MSIRVLIADDEALARRRLRRLLSAHPDCEVVGECGDGGSAVASIQELRPDLVFLDIQMPSRDGFAVLAELPPRSAPVVIFVTAHDEHAVRAFEVNALDYLLKPFSEPRFAQALDRARESIQKRDASGGPSSKHLERLFKDLLAKESTYSGHLLVCLQDRLLPVAVDRIRWVSADWRYVKLHVPGETHRLRQTLQQVESRLDPRRFVRIHRSTIVNIAFIHELHPLFHGDHRVVLDDDTELTLSRTFKDALFARMGKPV